MIVLKLTTRHTADLLAVILTNIQHSKVKICTCTCNITNYDKRKIKHMQGKSDNFYRGQLPTISKPRQTTNLVTFVTLSHDRTLNP